MQYCVKGWNADFCYTFRKIYAGEHTMTMQTDLAEQIAVDSLIDELQEETDLLEIGDGAKKLLVSTLDALREPGATYACISINRPTFSTPSGSLYFREKGWFYTFFYRYPCEEIEQFLDYFGCVEAKKPKKADITILYTLFAEARAATLIQKGSSVRFFSDDYYDSKCSISSGLPAMDEMYGGIRGDKFFRKRNLIVDENYILKLIRSTDIFGEYE